MAAVTSDENTLTVVVYYLHAQEVKRDKLTATSDSERYNQWFDKSV